MQLPLFRLSPIEQQAWLRHRFERPAPKSAINLSDGFRLPGREGMTKPAAVLIPLINRPDGLTVLFTERSVDLPDHPGQISFPGGRIEAEDADAIAAALREAEEEISLPRDRVRPLGRLADYETVTAFLLEPANQQTHFRMLGELRRDYHAIPYGERYIWGATAAMLLILDRTLREG